MKSLTPLVLLLLMATSFSCTKKGNTCSSPDSASDPNCQTQIPGVDSRPVTLNINYADSYFYDQTSQSWMTLQKNRLQAGGDPGITVPIYSNFVNLSVDAALQKIALASDQFQRPQLYNTADFSYVPYIELVAEDGAQYLFDYVKKDLSGNVIYEKNGQVPVINGRVILPLINAMFDGKFYSSDATINTRGTHSIAFAAQSKSQKGTISSTITFVTTFQIPPTGFLVDYSSSDAQNFTLDTRWNYYYNGADGIPNSRFKFLTLKENKTISEQIPLEFKVSFRDPPVLKIDEEVFFEMPMDYDTFKLSKAINPVRGNTFYVKQITLDSANDFNMAFRINNQDVAITNSKDLVPANALPAGTPWNIDFYYNFNSNLRPGLPLLTPLKPICNEFAGSTFSPIQEQAAKATAKANGGYISICHPTANKKVTFSASGTNNTSDQTLGLTDTWYNFFSYVPENTFKRELGHFYGVKKVRFYTEGCMRVYAREPGTSTWNSKYKNSQDPYCGGTPSQANDDGWIHYFGEKVVTIFDNLQNYQSVDGLVPILQSYSSRPINQVDDSSFMFNGVVGDNKHIY